MRQKAKKTSPKAAKKPKRPKRPKRIGVMTSGGDCAGLNPVIRAIVHRAILGYGWEVFGIRDGTEGLMRRPVAARRLTLADVEPPLWRAGGTILGTTSSGDPFAYAADKKGKGVDLSQRAIEGYRQLGLDAMICMGGDGSFKILRRLAAQGGLNIVAIPKTIDNDVGVTETAIGFDTAVEVATQALDRLQPTAKSHSRVMILEVMGRDAGHIALNTAIAGGADICLIPEIPYTLPSILKKIEAIRTREQRNFVLIVVGEAVKTESGQPVEMAHGAKKSYGGIGHYIGEQIQKKTGIETRVTVLGHVQRGAEPTAQDRLLAQAFGVKAVDLVARGKFDRMLAWQNRAIVDVPIAKGIESYRAVALGDTLLETARGLGISFGDS